MAKHRVAVIGCTGVGTRHASGLVGLPHADLVAACDLSQEVLNEFKKHWQDTWPDIVLYKDHRDLLEKENLDIVTVATSDHRHADLVVDAAAAGVRGIFCEKPMATNLTDADRMLAAVEQHHTILSIDHTRRWLPLWRHTREMVARGDIGPVQYLVGTLNGPRAMLFRNGTHLIDAICYFAAADPEWVVAELEAGYIERELLDLKQLLYRAPMSTLRENPPALALPFADEGIWLGDVSARDSDTCRSEGAHLAAVPCHVDGAAGSFDETLRDEIPGNAFTAEPVPSQCQSSAPIADRVLPAACG